MNKIVVPIILILFAVCNVCAQDIFPSEKDGLWGYVDNRGKWKIQPRYHYAGEFKEGLACVMNYYNHNNSIVKLYGYIDEKGEIKIPLQYNYASDFHHGIAIVGVLPGTHWEPTKEGNQGSVTSNLLELQFINKEGTLSKIENHIHYAEFLPNDSIGLYTCVFVSHSSSYRDSKKAYVAKEYYTVKLLQSEIEQYFYILGSIGGFARIEHNRIEKQIEKINSLDNFNFKWADSNGGIIYLVGNQILPIITEKINGTNPKNRKLIPKSRWGMYGFVSGDGTWVIPAKYDWIEEASDGVLKGYLRVHCSSGWGVMDSVGIIKISEQYDSIYSIDESFIAVMKDRNTGIMNDLWKVIIPPDEQRNHIRVHRKYNRITYMVNDGLWHMTDTMGVFVQQAYRFDDIWRININDKVISYGDSSGKLGLMGLDGKIVMEPSFDNIFFYDGFVMVKNWQSEQEGAVSFDGRVILPCKYFNVSGFGEIIEAVENNSDTNSKLYNIKGELLTDKNGLPILKKRHSGYYKGNSLVCIKTYKGYVIMTLDGVLLSEYYYVNVIHNVEEGTFSATRTDYIGNEFVDIFDDKKGKLLETIK